ncbi:TfoX/Sxy family protein [Actinomycetospora sp.]|uniref:TfoX/Sxy family protein n=1 Tax=Actinomycetospora sp. TaxID=1872135 RepID=UPI002F4022FA
MAHDEELAERVRAALNGQEGLTEKRMFGGLAFLLDGHMAVASSSQGGIMVRVDPAREDQLLAGLGVEPMIMRGRPMTGWLRVAREQLDDAALRGWVGEGVAYVRTLPPK